MICDVKTANHERPGDGVIPVARASAAGQRPARRPAGRQASERAARRFRGGRGVCNRDDGIKGTYPMPVKFFDTENLTVMEIVIERADQKTRGC